MTSHKIILLALVLGTFMTALDATIVSVALPTIAEELGESGHDTSNISWILLVYTLMMGCFILLWAKIGTRRGYKKVFVTGISIFTTTSLLIGLCGTIEQFGLPVMILLRAIQGLGAGMVMSMSLAIVSTYLSKEVRGSSIGIVTLSTSIGTAMGPALGGVLTSFHWSYIFFINVPIGIACLVLCLRYMHVDEHLPETKTRLDIVGAILLLAMLFSLILYLNEGSDIGWTSYFGIGLIMVAAVAAGLLSRWEQRVSDPLVSLDILKRPNVLRCCLITLLLFMTMAGSYLLLPYYLGFVKGFSTIEYGLILVANSVGMMVMSPIVGRISDRTGKTRQFAIIGSLMCAAGFLMMSRFDADTGLIWILAALFLMGAGIGTALVTTTNLAFSGISEGENGLMSGISNTFRQVGCSSGVAVLNAVFMAFIITGPLSPGGLVPGFHHAFFVAIVITLIAFILAMGLKDRDGTARSLFHELPGALRHLDKLLMGHLRQALQVVEELAGGTAGLHLHHLHVESRDQAGEYGHQGDGVDGQEHRQDAPDIRIDQKVAVADRGHGLEGEPQSIGKVLYVRIEVPDDQ